MSVGDGFLQIIREQRSEIAELKKKVTDDKNARWVDERNTVTITISRETAEDYIAARVDDSSLYWAEGEILYAIREALKEPW